MPNQNRQNSRTHQKTDASRTYLDANNTEWVIDAEFMLKRGRVDLHSLTITSLSESPITRRLLKELPLDNLFRDEMVSEENSTLKQKRKINSNSSHQGRAHSDEEIQLVAEIYIAAYLGHVSVENAVANAFGISVSTASKRIMVARTRGFIPENMTTRNV